MSTDYEAFLEEIKADADKLGVDNSEEFFQRISIMSADIGQSPDIESVSVFQQTPKGSIAQLSGYAYEDIGSGVLLTLCICDFEETSLESQPLRKSDLDQLFNRVKNAWDLIQSHEFFTTAQNDPGACELGAFISENLNQIIRINVLIFSNRTLAIRAKEIANVEHDGKKWATNIIDWPSIERYEKEGTDPILIDFIKDELQPLPCVKAFSGDKMESYLLLSLTLAEIYSRYQSRLLESNVRAFTKATKTNKAIQTLCNEPQRFFAYNNGITATASNAEVSEINGQQCITKIEDLQIVNSKQAPASMVYAQDQKHDEENLSQVLCKLN